jgi:Zn finger protein HypA/HybF involved in hydrogenase expression
VSVLQANCPSCAAPVEFKAGSTIVLICPYCRSAIARTDRGLEDLGKVAEIVESQSPLKIGLKGEFKGARFELTGRAQLRHELGGTWDEWYATFSNGWVGWLAEAQGNFYLTFYQPLPQGTSPPPFDQLQVGQTVAEIPSPTPLMVVEKGVATGVAAAGEIPYKLVPNEQSRYADLSGRDNAFGTIDYSNEPPWVFLGQQVSLADIGLADARPAERDARRVSTAAMGCPNCGGPLTLSVPDKTERVVCPNCESLLDVNQGNLTYLKSLKTTQADKSFVLPLGAEGTFKDVKFKVIGAVVRSVDVDGQTYYWHEYLMYNPAVGFRWLVHSDNHWNFVEPVNPADVTVNQGFAGNRSATYNGRTYRIFQDAQAMVRYVVGEFYWKVEQHETVQAADYVSAPLMLSQESTGNEINWSMGSYLTNADIEKAFGVSDLPKPWSVAPNQPFTGRFYYTWGLVPLLLLIVVAIFMIPLTGMTNTVHSETITLQPSVGTAAAPQIAFSRPFDLKGNRNVRITATAPVNNSAADLDIDLVNEQNNEVEQVSIPISFYQGVEDGESWSEGSPTNDATLSSLAAGQYRLRVEGTLESVTQPLNVDLKVEQNVNRGVNFLCAFIVLLIIPVLGLIRKISFESRRWKDSMFSTSSE